MKSKSTTSLPEEANKKAKEIFQQFMEWASSDNGLGIHSTKHIRNNALNCAHYLVDEIIKHTSEGEWKSIFWTQVKNELQKV